MSEPAFAIVARGTLARMRELRELLGRASIPAQILRPDDCNRSR